MRDDSDGFPSEADSPPSREVPMEHVESTPFPSEAESPPAAQELPASFAPCSIAMGTVEGDTRRPGMYLETSAFVRVMNGTACSITAQYSHHPCGNWLYPRGPIKEPGCWLLHSTSPTAERSRRSTIHGWTD
jgi:hypothetical protein